MPQRVLIIGGTRNLGPGLVRRLLEDGYAVTVLNRGVTPDDLPAEVERLHADRGDPRQLRGALARREFDVAIDLVLFNGAEAAATVEVLDGLVGHYVFISSGQVYLVRRAAVPPFRESDYEGEVIAAPHERFDLDNWRYGIGKREAEDVMAQAWLRRNFPYTSLRIPMVNSERDHHHRLHGYVRRLREGGPILVTQEPAPRLRHIYGPDVIAAAAALVASGAGKGRAYNLAQDETLGLEDFLARLAVLAGTASPRRVAVPRRLLLAAGLFPQCSPFSDPWMSEMDTTRAAAEIGTGFTPVADYLPTLAAYWRDKNDPPGYERRDRELELARQFSRR
jgi:nucleoside-diphosphate-sugar epimerase